MRAEHKNDEYKRSSLLERRSTNEVITPLKNYTYYLLPGGLKRKKNGGK